MRTGMHVGVHDFLQIVDIRTKIVSLSSLAIGTAYAVHLTHAFSLLYSGGPVPIARLPVGEIFAGGLLGLVLIVVAAFVQTRSVHPRVVLLGLPSSTLIATILSVNNLCDVEGDAKAGRRTLAIVLGSARAERLIHLQAAVTLLLAVALVPLGVLPASALLPIAVAALLGWREFAAMHRRGYSHATKAASMGGISRVFLVYTLAVLMGIGLGRVPQ